MPHEYKEPTNCSCYILAEEPSEDCYMHGHPWPPRCGECGRFMPWSCRYPYLTAEEDEQTTTLT